MANIEMKHVIIGDNDYEIVDEQARTNIENIQKDISVYLTKMDVVDNLESDAENLPLSAKQGKNLKEEIDTKQDTLSNSNLSNSDLNNLKTKNGIWRVPSTNSNSNRPVTDTNAILKVSRSSAGCVLQEFFTEDGNMYFRIYTLSAWTSWKKVTTTAVS